MNLFWLEQADADVPEADDWLSPEEIHRMKGMRFAKRRSEWRLGRWTAKCAVAAYLKTPAGLAFSEIEIPASSSGAPAVVIDRTPAAMTISISHRDGLALCAIGPGNLALGCDVELIEPHSQVFISDYFTAEEQQLVESVSPTDRCLTIALLWSAKESALKALQEGLRSSTHSVVVIPGQMAPNRDSSRDSAAALSGFCDSLTVWHPLQVRRAEDKIFGGWWRRDAQFVMTLVSAPSSEYPAYLRSSCKLSAAQFGTENSTQRNHSSGCHSVDAIGELYEPTP